MTRSKRQQTAQSPSRRGFFRMLPGELWSIFEAAKGIPQLRLDELDDLPDEILGQLVPAMDPAWQIRVDERAVRAKYPRKNRDVELFDNSERNRIIFNQFNSTNTIDECARLVAEQCDISSADAFSDVRRLFLHLVYCGVCAPANEMSDD